MGASASSLVVAFVGAGHVASVLGRLLADAGVRISAVVSRRASSARRVARFVGSARASTRLGQIPPETNLIYLTTPHAAVEPVAAALAEEAELQFRALSVCHASGMLTAAALAPLARKGARVFSFHPLQVFPRDLPARTLVASARGIPFGADGEPAALRVAAKLARELGGRLLVVPPEKRALYHAACIAATNHLTAVLWEVEQLFAALGTDTHPFFPVFAPIVNATLAAVASSSPAQALTGAVARGGVDTVAGHVGAVRAFAPEQLESFTRLTDETVKLALAKGSITPNQAKALRAVLGRPAAPGRRRPGR